MQSYRLEDFSHAAKLYKDLSADEAAVQNEENDIRINSGATDAQLEWQKQGHLVQKKKAGREDLEAFETAYNAACGSIARDELGQSEVLLKRAKGNFVLGSSYQGSRVRLDLCNSLDELSDQEKMAEIRPICVQQLYVLSILGKNEEMEKIALDIGLDE